ncbi:MAG: hypothetical protein MJ171_06125 [Clostridia bacterium]|nr:hypothetical protein [Clostridia bacterium]
MKYLIQHTVLGFCWWDLLALVAVIGVIIYSWRKLKKVKDLKEELEDRLAERDSAKTLDGKDK